MLHDTYKIVWQKWIDPFGQDQEESISLDYENENPDLSSSVYSRLDKNEETTDDEDEFLIKKRSIKVIASPMGLIPYNEHTASGKIFNFWLGHTNFDITINVSKIIENTDGVEALDIFTRYRFRVAIGKCFGASETMVRIQENICRYLDEQESDELS
jgi:hypothetical protein